jgi:hypothetical protein
MRGSVVQKPAGSGRWYVVVEMACDPGNGARRRKWHSGFPVSRSTDGTPTAWLRELQRPPAFRGTSAHTLCGTRQSPTLDAGVPLRDAQILARHADPRTTEHYDRARGNLDRHGVHFLTAYVAGV